MRRISRPAPAALVLGALALAPFALVLAPPYWIFLGTTAAITAIIARSLGLLTGQTGAISLCQLSFAAIGAATVGWLNLHAVPVPFPLAIVIGGLAAAPFGMLVGLPALRLRGVNFAVVTLSFATATDIYLSTKGFRGADITNPVILTGPLGDPRTYFALCWAVFVMVAAGLGAIGRSRLGSAWLAVRGSERATAAMGISVARTKLSAFVISAGVAGISGGLLAGQLSILTSAQFQPVASLVTFAVAVMIGAHFAEGAAVAGALSAFVPELLRRIGLPLDFGDLLFALGAINVLRRGRGGAADRLRRRLRDRRLRRAGVRPEPGSGRTPGPEPGSGPAPGPEPGSGPAPGPEPARAGRPLPARTRPALQLRGLTVRFGQVVALDGVDLLVPPRQVSALIGPNGAGKSTLVDAVTGFLPAYQGAVTVDGVAIDRLSVHRRARAGVRRTFQYDRTIAELTVGRYVRLVARRALTDRELDETLAFLDCPPAGTPIDTVDVGARRLVEVAAVLAARPAIAMLDEPAAGLADHESRQLANRIAEIPERFGCGVLLIEHDMAHVMAASSTVTALSSGRVVASGSPQEVLADVTVVAGYLGAELEVGSP